VDGRSTCKIEDAGRWINDRNVQSLGYVTISHDLMACLFSEHSGSRRCKLSSCNRVFPFPLFYATFQLAISSRGEISKKILA
jgi:hypothetical protein